MRLAPLLKIGFHNLNKKTEMQNKLTVGQAVWIVGCGNRKSGEPKETKIVLVAKKYFTVEGHWKRFHIQSLKVDSGEYMADYRVVLSLEAHEQERELAKTWSEIYKFVANHYPPPVNLETAKQILSLLSIEKI